MTLPLLSSCRYNSSKKNRVLLSLFFLLKIGSSVHALNGGTAKLKANPKLGWKILEIVSENDVVDGWDMPKDFDGLGAWLVDSDGDDDSSLRFLINHETPGDSTISEVNVHTTRLKAIVNQMLRSPAVDGSSLGIEFVQSARQAFGRFSSDLGNTWNYTSRRGEVPFDNFCSGQSYKPHTFGYNRGFVDPLYITGEEENWGRLVVLDSANRDLYQLSGKVGHAQWKTGNGGIPYDSWENAALLDTGPEHTDRVALLLSSDGGSDSLQLYIGLKNMTRNCQPVVGDDSINDAEPSFLERNGLACGRWWFLTGIFPEWPGESETGSFSKSPTNRLKADKLEDIDTSPSDPTKVALTAQYDGVFVFSFDLQFTSAEEGGIFDPTASSFEVTMVADLSSRSHFDAPDGVEWTAATTLGGIDYPDGLLFINEDNGDGFVDVMNPDGSNPRSIAKVTDGGASCGTLDISRLLGYRPASVLATSSMGDQGSLAIMINPNATLLSSPIELPTDETSSLSPVVTQAPLIMDQDAFHNINQTIVVDMKWSWSDEIKKKPSKTITSRPESRGGNRRALIGPYEE